MEDRKLQEGAPEYCLRRALIAVMEPTRVITPLGSTFP